MTSAPQKTPLAVRCGIAACAALLTLAAACASAQEQWRFSGASRIVAIGDVHGAYDALTDLLRTTGVVDAELAWSGGDAHLVSLGDLLDRGPESRAVMDLFMRLQREAEAAGGRVHVVLGNHELMNLTGDLRYVSDAEYAAFAADEPAAARQAAYAAFLAERESEGTPDLEAEFEQRHPPGYFGHRIAFGPDGEYGAWLVSLPALVVVDGTAFVHGGLPELVASTGLGVNDRIEQTLRGYLAARAELAEAGVLPRYRMERDAELARTALEGEGGAASEHVATLERFLALADAPELGLDGPMWYRGSVYCNDLLERPVLDAALERLEATSVVVGHTPTADRRVRAAYDGRLVMLDTGMLADYYDGRPAALIIEAGERRAQYLVPDETAAVESGAALAYGLSEPELLRALADAAVEPAGESPGAVRLRHDGTMLEAHFYEPGDAAEHELAAFALDRLLGLDLVPPTVAREIDGRAGALQLRFPDGVSETERLERGLAYGWCPVAPQAQLMYALDLLTLNAGRTPDNLRYRNGLSNLVLVDHTEAFGTQRTLPDSLNIELDLPPPLVAALRALDEPTLEAALDEWLDRRELRALLPRRDALVELADR